MPLKTAEDYSSKKVETQPLDIVERIFDSQHDRFCRYEPFITKSGLIYCSTCGQQIGCLHPEHH